MKLKHVSKIKKIYYLKLPIIISFVWDFPVQVMQSTYSFQPNELNCTFCLVLSQLEWILKLSYHFLEPKMTQDTKNE